MQLGTTLTVRSRLRTPQSTTEARFEKRVADCLEKIGLMSFHTSEKYVAGIPDRYVVGGNWIEFKVYPCGGGRRVNAHRLFSEQQKNYLSAFHRNGDRTWVAVMFQPIHSDAYIVIEPWRSFRQYWRREDWECCGIHAKRDNLLEYVRVRFDQSYDRCSSPEIYNADH